MKLKVRVKTPIEFGRQIRSYVLDRNEVVDHRTGVRARATDTLNGNLSVFLRAGIILRNLMKPRE